MDSPAEEEDKPRVDNLVEADSREMEVDNPVEVAGNPVEVDIRQAEEVDNPAEAVDNNRPAVVGSPAAVEADNSLPVEGLRRRRVCRTWGKKCCPGSKACRSWGNRMPADRRKRYRISGRGRY